MVGPEPIDTTVSKQAGKGYYSSAGFFVSLFVCLICYAKRHSNTFWF